MKQDEIKKVFESLEPNETLVRIETEDHRKMLLRFKFYKKKVFAFSDGFNLPLYYLSDGRPATQEGNPLPKSGLDIVEIEQMSIDELIHSANGVKRNLKLFLNNNTILGFLLG